MGLVHICQKYGKCLSHKVKEIAGRIKYKDADKMAHAKRKGLPNRVKSFKEYVMEIENESKVL